MPKSPLLTPSGRLSGNRLNKRELAVLDKQAVRILQFTVDFREDPGTVATHGTGIFLPANILIAQDNIIIEHVELAAGGSGNIRLREAAGGNVLSGSVDTESTIGVVVASTGRVLPTESEIQYEISSAPVVAGSGIMKFTIPYIRL